MLFVLNENKENLKMDKKIHNIYNSRGGMQNIKTKKWTVTQSSYPLIILTAGPL